MKHFQPLYWHRLQAMVTMAGAAAVIGLSMGAGASGAIAPAAPLNTDETEASISQHLINDFCPSDLAAAIDGIIRRPQFATANWGILMSPLTDNSILYAHNAEQLLIPASNMKLLTTAAAIRTIVDQAPEALGDFRDDLTLVNRNSNNARADELLRGIGGQSQVREMLAPLGVSPDSFTQADGSGLSRANQAEPSTFVTLLKGMYATDEGALFYDSLPVGGVNGTLRNRFKGTPVQGKVHAKTGTLRGVRALSGYLETDTYGILAFSIVINQSGQSGSVMLDAIDEIVLTLSSLQVCE